VAGSPDGTTIFYVDLGTVWAVPAGDGGPREIRRGNGVAVDPSGRDLLIKRNEQAGVWLIRVPISGGSEQESRVQGSLWRFRPENEAR
jgi:hypothetical protein